MIEYYGQHRLEIGSIADEGGQLMSASPKADIMYVDPPWGQAMLQFFRNLKARQTGEVSRAWPMWSTSGRSQGTLRRIAVGLCS